MSVREHLKKFWNTALTSYKEKYYVLKDKTSFFRVFDEAWDPTEAKLVNVVSDFRKAGLVPFDENALGYY